MSFTGTFIKGKTPVIPPVVISEAKGLEYMADYFDNITDRTLIDRVYMDNALGIPKYILGHDPWPGDLVIASSLALMAAQDVHPD